MRAIPTRLTPLFAGAMVLALSSMVGATSYYWDTNGSSAGIGSAGGSAAAWLSNSWATANTGTAPTAAWPNTQPVNADEAVFMGTAGTVNLAADVYANAVRFQTNNYTIASTGGMLHLAGTDPKITVNLAGSNQVVTISAPLIASGGLNLAGNSLTGGLKFLVLANANLATPNSFGGPLTIEAGGALRLGGGQEAEQIPDNSDLNVAGVIDFITSGGASDGKQEKVRDVTVSGANANFSVGNESNFVVNSITGTGTSGPGIAINGNNGTAPNVPGKLSITGWSSGSGDLTLQDGRVRLNTTGGTSAVGSRVVLSGDIESSGASSVTNVNGGGANINTNTFANKGFDFAGTAHTVHVSDGTLTFSSAAAAHPLEITTTQPGGAVVTKTGAGVWRLENAVQTNFVGAIKIQEGGMSLGNPGLAVATDVYLGGTGTLDLGFAGIDQIDSLYFDDVSQASGTWGRLGHPTADFTSALLTGNGLLQVTTFVQPLLVGDFNNDEVVDAADYTVWRDNLGGTNVLPNDQTPESVSSEDYDDWKLNFGMSAPDGAGGTTTALPEANSILTVLAAFVAIAGNPQRIKR